VIPRVAQDDDVGAWEVSPTDEIRDNTMSRSEEKAEETAVPAKKRVWTVLHLNLIPPSPPLIMAFINATNLPP
jgi:hypothetical protein